MEEKKREGKEWVKNKYRRVERNGSKLDGKKGKKLEEN